MNHPAPQWRSISEDQLAKMIAQGSYSGAAAALERAERIGRAGHKAAIFHDRSDGFLVLDESDPQQRSRAISLRKRPGS